MIRYIERQLYRLKKIFAYSWYIWRKDFDWDSYYLLELMRIKMRLMEKCFREEGHLESNIRNADEIKICIGLIDRILEDDYCKLDYENHKKKWGGSEWITHPTKNKNITRLEIRYPNARTEEEKKQCDKEFLDIGRKSGYLLEQDTKFLFDIMGRKIRTWWD